MSFIKVQACKSIKKNMNEHSKLLLTLKYIVELLYCYYSKQILMHVITRDGS